MIELVKPLEAAPPLQMSADVPADIERALAHFRARLLTAFPGQIRHVILKECR